MTATNVIISKRASVIKKPQVRVTLSMQVEGKNNLGRLKVATQAYWQRKRM